MHSSPVPSLPPSEYLAVGRSVDFPYRSAEAHSWCRSTAAAVAAALGATPIFLVTIGGGSVGEVTWVCPLTVDTHGWQYEAISGDAQSREPHAAPTEARTPLRFGVDIDRLISATDKLEGEFVATLEAQVAEGQLESVLGVGQEMADRVVMTSGLGVTYAERVVGQLGVLTWRTSARKVLRLCNASRALRRDPYYQRCRDELISVSVGSAVSLRLQQRMNLVEYQASRATRWGMFR